MKSGYNGRMTRISALPLFPLNTVLFPGQLLPLHIFEPRYHTLVSECLAAESPFGVVLIREGREVGAAAVPFDVGTTARIGQVERLDDGRLNILCVGDTRFRLKRVFHDRPFLTGHVDVWPWEPLSAADAEPRASRIKQLLTRYVLLLSKATGNAVSLDEMPTDAERLANLAAIVLQVPNHEKQTLLSVASLSDLLDGCIDLLKRENRAISIASSIPSDLTGDSLPFSSN